MIGKTIRAGAILTAAVGVPMAMFNEPLADTLKKNWPSALTTESTDSWSDEFDASDTDPRSGTPDAGVLGNQAAGSIGAKPTLTGVETRELSDVLRFDINPRWVTERWSHVSTFNSERSLLAMRVPLLTGTAPHDLAGSLTYYFDTRHRLQRIVFVGRTGDERPLADYVGRSFGLRPEPNIAAGLYLARWNAQPHNVLYIRHAPVVRADSPHARYDVRLEINQLDIGVRLTDESTKMLASLYEARGW